MKFGHRIIVIGFLGTFLLIFDILLGVFTEIGTEFLFSPEYIILQSAILWFVAPIFSEIPFFKNTTEFSNNLLYILIGGFLLIFSALIITNI